MRAEVPLTVVEPQPSGVHLCQAKPPDRLQGTNTLHSRQVDKKLLSPQLIGLLFEACENTASSRRVAVLPLERCEGEHLIILKLSERKECKS